MTAAPAQLPLDLRNPPLRRRADLVAGAPNAEALARMDGWRDWPGGALVLLGPPGVGKSHLAEAWLHETAGVSLAADTPTNRFPPRGQAVWIDRADEGADDATLFHLLNRAVCGEGALLLTSRIAPALWPATLPDLRSRLNALAVAEIGEPDDGTLTDLLVRFFRARAARPSPELLRYLVFRMDRSAASAAEIVERLHAASGGGRIGLSLARRLLGDEPAELFDEVDPPGRD